MSESVHYLSGTVEGGTAEGDWSIPSFRTDFNDHRYFQNHMFQIKMIQAFFFL